jgi:hypothetical protein
MLYHRRPSAGKFDIRHRANLSLAVILIGRRYHLKPNMAKTVAELAGYPTAMED